MKRLVAVAFAAVAIYILFATYSSHVFDVLIYDESRLMPPDIEPKLVDAILKNSTAGESKARSLPVVIFGPRIEEKARNLSRLYPNTTSAWSILDTALNVYNEKVNEILDNATARFRKVALEISNSTKEVCKELENLAEGYRRAREEARRLIMGTYGVVALGKAVDNATGKFLSIYNNLVGAYDIDTAVRIAADMAYGNVSRYLTNVTWNNWATEKAVDSVAAEMLSTQLNKTLIDLARTVSAIGVQQYVYLSLVNKTPDVLRPYLHYLICGGDVEMAVSMFRNNLLRNITNAWPPPSLFSLPAAANLIYQEKYALAIVKTYEETPHIPLELGVPVSTSFLLKSFTQVVIEDVSKIDRATALALFLVMLAIMGTIITPVLIVSIVGVTYLAVLGFFYQIHEVQKIYYLTVYMAAPVIFAIGVDYMLLMASRYAEERALGKEKSEAVASVRRYANRAIAASAAVVATSLGSFTISRLPFMQSIGIGYIITTIFIVLSVFLIFPAALYILGDKVFWPKKTVSIHSGRSKLMEMAVSTALKKPLTIILIAVTVTLLSFLFLITALKVTTNPVVAMPETQYKKALEIATTYFSNITALSTTYILMEKPPPPGFLTELEKMPHFVNYTVEKRGNWYVISLKLSVEETSDELLKVYRKLDELRAAYGPYLIGGSASWKNIIFQEIYVQFWNMQVYLVLVVVFIILSILLKSFLIPLRLIATVLMSISWSLALEVFIFQELLGEPTYWLVPIILFAFLMAVGTDYDIFIITRIREELERGAEEKEAVRKAIVTTGPVITGAAIILAAAFSTLLLSQTTLLRQVGFTIAFAALVDAFIVRPFIVPALIVLAGKYNWVWIGGYSVKKSFK
nr:MMPL family transporter [Pyrobaculum sp.]